MEAESFEVEEVESCFGKNLVEVENYCGQNYYWEGENWEVGAEMNAEVRENLVDCC